MSVNREDLEDVCHDFWAHTADNVSAEKYLSSPHRFVTKYFDRYASYTDEVRNTVETIIAGSRTKRAETVVGMAADAESEKRHPVIVLLRDIEGYEQATPFSCFYVVKARRSKGFQSVQTANICHGQGLGRVVPEFFENSQHLTAAHQTVC